MDRAKTDGQTQDRTNNIVDIDVLMHVMVTQNVDDNDMNRGTICLHGLQLETLDKSRQIRLSDFNDRCIEHVVLGTGTTLLRCLLESQAELTTRQL